MAAIAPPPPSVATPVAPQPPVDTGLPTPPTPNAEPRTNGPIKGSSGLESRLAQALTPSAAPQTPADPAPSAVAPAPAPPGEAPPEGGEEPPAETSFTDFDFEKPLEEVTPPSPTTDPLEAVKDDLLAEGELSRAQADRIRGAFLKTEHGRQMYAAHQIRQELEKPPEEGGLGRFPTLEEIRQGEADRLAMAEMTEDFTSNPENWMANFFGYRDAQGQVQFRPGVERIVESLPAHLQQVAPELHSRLAAQAVAPYLQALAQEISRLPHGTREEADAKLVWGRGLNAIEQRLLGRITRIPGFQYEDGGGAPQNGGPDPLASERQRLAQEREAFQRQQQESARAAQQAAHQEILSARDSALAGDARAILRSAGLDRTYPPMVFDQLAQTFLSQVLSSVDGDSRNAKSPSNPASLKTYHLHLRSAVAGQADRNLPVQTYRRMAQEVMRRDAKDFIAKAIGNAQATNQSLHAAASAASSRKEAAPGASPQGAPPAPVKSAARPAGMSGAEFLENRVREALGGTA